MRYVRFVSPRIALILALSVFLFLAVFTMSSGRAHAAIAAYTDAFYNFPTRLPEDNYDLRKNGSVVASSSDCGGAHGCTAESYNRVLDNGGQGHQYITISNDSIDDQNNPGDTKYATSQEFIVYSLGKADRDVSILVTGRRINNACDNFVNAYYFTYETASPRGQNGFKRTGGCQASTDMGQIPADAFEMMQVNGVDTGIYRARLVIKFGSKAQNPVGSQTSFSLRVTGSRLGYPASSSPVRPSTVPSGEHGWVNQYPTNFADDHSVAFVFKPPCGTPENTNISLNWWDLDYPPSNGIQNVQPTIKVYKFVPGDSDYRKNSNLIYSVNFPGDNDSRSGAKTEEISPGNPYSYVAVFENIRGGNGLNFEFPFDSGPGFPCPTPPVEDTTCTTFTRTIQPRSRYRFTYYPTGRLGFNTPSVSPNAPSPSSNTEAGNAPPTPESARWNDYGDTMKLKEVNQSNTTDDPYDYSDSMPNPEGQGYRVIIEKWQRVGTQDLWQFSSTQVDTYNAATGQDCYQADCQLSVLSNVPGGPANSVKGGESFTAVAKLINRGRQPFKANYGLGVYSASDSSFTGLSIGMSPSEALNGKYFSLDAPDDINNTHKIKLTTAYAGHFYLGAGCEQTVSTYQPFKLDPLVNSVTANDNEDPTTITYNTQVGQDLTGEHASLTAYTVPAISKRWLYKNQPGTILDGPAVDPAGSRFADNGNPETFTATYNNTSIARDMVVGDQFCGHVEVYPATGWIGPGDDIRDPAGAEDNSCGTVTDRPFVRIYGSDVFAGGKFGSPGNEGTGDIKTYVKQATNVSEGTEYGAGSGVEFAAIALGTIERTTDVSTGFTSASLRSSNTPPTTPSGLSLATPGAGFGGNFAGSRMATDYFRTKFAETALTAGTNAINIADPATNNKQVGAKPSAGNKVTLGNVNNYSGHRSIYVEGDVFINGDIIYAGSGGWATLSAIPSLGIIVKGNIYISNTVNQLDGMYVAQPNDAGSGGKIYTCAKTTGAPYTNADQAQMYTECNRKLKVNGAFISKETKLLRTKDTISNVPVVPGTPAPATPGVGGFIGIDNGAYTVVGDINVRNSHSKCVMMHEDSDPNWGGPAHTNDNYFCYDSSIQLNWYHGGIHAKPVIETECASFDNPREDPAHTWADNYLCAPNGSNVGLEVVWPNIVGGVKQLGAVPAGKQCTEINESNWAASEPGGALTTPWAKVQICYKPSIMGTNGTPAIPLRYVRETFANDHAAESFRLSPEMFLAQPIQLPETGLSTGKYDQILSLPPVL